MCKKSFFHTKIRWGLVALAVFVGAALAVPPSALARAVKAELVAEASEVKISPVKPFYVAVKFTISDGWHTYYKESGDTGEPTEIRLSLPRGLVAGEVEWQKPLSFNTAGFTEYGYTGEAYHFIPVYAKADGFSRDKVAVTAEVRWLECGYGECVPERAGLTLMIPVGDKGVANEEFAAAWQKREVLPKAEAVATATATATDSPLPRENKVAGAEKTEDNGDFWQVLLLALLGGLVLNFMPCVFPVVSLKICGLVKVSEGAARRSSFAYTAGVVLSFVAVAVLVIGAKAGGEALGWGFQLQNPKFVLFLVLLLFVLGLMFSGLVKIPPLFQNYAAKGKGAFWSGVLAVLLSSPCVAPFMGTAVAYGLAVEGAQALLIFVVMGLGLALPILILSFWRGWAKWLPKNGKWTLVLQKILAVPLYISAVWLLWVLFRQAGAEGAVVALALLVGTALAALVRRREVWLVLLAAAVVGLVWVQAAPLKNTSALLEDWQAYSEEVLAENVGKGRPVFVKFTAAWCLTCFVNEKMVLDTPEITALWKDKKVLLLKADWTNKSAGILGALRKYGKNGIPLYVYYGAHSDSPVILPRIITKQDIKEALEGK